MAIFLLLLQWALLTGAVVATALAVTSVLRRVGLLAPPDEVIDVLHPPPDYQSDGGASMERMHHRWLVYEAWFPSLLWILLFVLRRLLNG